ncbi:hypothetical protein [Stakelama tenebrarum]|uniref:Uncharacterized protein n=1 Tax=Stakelama tenebrarum TaxID=2711215 RepID=A0A6G6Y2Y9_9SPHN|nr:hypothetical protein [Sphingosinithalassobacter tenebrarum]QIG78936.1 hypothetical protein G5C33_03470 [Sphingosinithalassobacter tenebrarum]
MWGRKKKSSLREKLPFKTAKGFFEYQCKYGGTRLEEGLGIVALVLDARKEFGTSVAVKREENGCQLAALRVAAEDGGFITFALTASQRGENLRPDDIVIWVPGDYLPAIAQQFDDERCGWVGLIVAKIAPEMPVQAGVPWTILSEYS